MTPERWAQVNDVFQRAMQLAALERPGFVDQACKDDDELRREVKGLLAASDEAGSSFLRSPQAVGLTKGTPLGEYEVHSLLGSGGMGEVYRARDLRLRRDVAIKVLPAFVSSNPERLRRFEQEALATAALNHPNILAVYQMGSHQGVPYLVTELLEGETLREKVRHERIDVSKAIGHAVQVARGLTAAHEKGIVHRDLKPDNIFVTKDGRIKILDFGLAKLTQTPQSSQHSSPTLDSETEPGMVMGTAGYMAPEQVRAEAVDHRADIFAFGAVLYEMLTGQRAFQKPTSVETMTAILNDEPAPLAQIAPEIPLALSRVVARCLEKNPGQRFQSASDLAFALESLSDFPAHARQLQKNLGSRRNLRWTLIGLALAALVAVAVIATLTSYWSIHEDNEPDTHTTKLTDKDTIVLAPFDNRTGEAVFDDALYQALSIQLGQSPFLKILSISTVAETLTLMRRRPDEPLTADLAKEICVRSGSKAVLQGSISRLGSEYLLGLRATACLTGEVLNESQGEARSKEEVLKTLSNMASDTRARLGESLASVRRFDYQKPTTTTSLEALKVFSIGRRALEEHGTDAAIPFFKRAIELDPNFSEAYVSLAKMYGNLGESELAAEDAAKAYNLRDRVSEEEKYDITSQYHFEVTGSLDQALEDYDAWIRAYPRAATPLHNRSNILWELGQYEQALEGYKASLHLEPNFAYGYLATAIVNTSLNRIDQAKGALDDLKQNGLDPEIGWEVFYNIAFLRNELPEMGRQLQIGRANPESESDALRHEAATYAYHGQFGKTRELTLRATQLQNQPELRNAAAEGMVDLALQEAVCGNRSAAKSAAISALSKGTSRTVRGKAAVALAEAGELMRARILIAELEKAYPLDTFLNRGWLPLARAIIHIKQGNGRLAVEALQPALDFERGRIALFPAYVRGQAYLAAQDPTAAIAEFQKLLDHPGIVLNNPIGALARLQTGKAYLISGNEGNAKQAYGEFLALWKDADPDIRVFQQAKAQYTRLH